MVAVHLGRGGLFQLVGVDGAITASLSYSFRPGHCRLLGRLQAHALGDAGKGFGVAAQRAGDHGVETMPPPAKYSPRRTLLVAQRLSLS
jgi:hypothetical protein